MTRAKTTMLLMARWLIVLAASLVVSSGNLLAAAPTRADSSCDASCSRECPCCISQSTPADSAPLAPSPATRTAVAKDFPFAAHCDALLAEREDEAPVPAHFSVPHFSVPLPLFLRHCAFLL